MPRWSRAEHAAFVRVRARTGSHRENGLVRVRHMTPATDHCPETGPAGMPGLFLCTRSRVSHQRSFLDSVASGHGPPSARHAGQRGFAGPPQCLDQTETVFAGEGSGTAFARAREPDPELSPRSRPGGFPAVYCISCETAHGIRERHPHDPNPTALTDGSAACTARRPRAQPPQRASGFPRRPWPRTSSPTEVMTLDDVARAWMRYVEHEQERKPSTVRDYRNTMRRRANGHTSGTLAGISGHSLGTSWSGRLGRAHHTICGVVGGGSHSPSGEATLAQGRAVGVMHRVGARPRQSPRCAHGRTRAPPPR